MGGSILSKINKKVNNPHLRWGLYPTPERGYSSE